MKNLVSRIELLMRFLAMRRLTPLLAVLLAITGCQTDQSDFSTPPPPEQASQPAAPSKASAPAHTEPILLRGGDTVSVTFPGSSSLNTTQQIRRDGKIVMPLIGEVVAAGKTPEQLQAELIKLYAPQISTKQVIVTVQSSNFQVYVTGAVLRPGPVVSNHPITALDAIMEAGGFDYTKANLKSVVIIRQENEGTTKFTVNLKKAMQGGQEKPFYLKPSDIVRVPEKFTWF